MPRAWRVLWRFERELGRPLVCAWQVDGSTLVEEPRGLQKALDRCVYSDRSPMFKIKSEEYRKLSERTRRAWSSTTCPVRPGPRSARRSPSWRCARTLRAILPGPTGSRSCAASFAATAGRWRGRAAWANGAHQDLPANRHGAGGDLPRRCHHARRRLLGAGHDDRPSCAGTAAWA